VSPHVIRPSKNGLGLSPSAAGMAATAHWRTVRMSETPSTRRPLSRPSIELAPIRQLRLARRLQHAEAGDFRAPQRLAALPLPSTVR
jgi:hypothetical protein